MGAERALWVLPPLLALGFLCSACALGPPSPPPSAPRHDRDVQAAALREALRSAQAGLRARGSPPSPLLARLSDGLGSGRSLDEVLAAETVPGPAAAVLLTGYYEPILAARWTRTQRFRFPLHGLPGGASRRASRAEIEEGALRGKALELFWLDDPIESFFLHIQGSGRLVLEDGSVVGVGYAGNNGHSYHSIGKELVARGELRAEEATAPAIKAWLRAHPAEQQEILRTNPRYIFFRETEPGESGPVGALGVPLVALVSVAVDPDVTPLGSVGVLEAPLPDGSILEQVVVAMDTGAAIRGSHRVDLFIGAGREAGDLAGVLRSRGRITWLRAGDPRSRD